MVVHELFVEKDKRIRMRPETSKSLDLQGEQKHECTIGKSQFNKIKT